MNYIKDLYEKNPSVVKKLIKKLFNLEREQDVFLVNPDEGLIGENDIMFNFINKKNGKVEVILLEDFAICYGLEYLEMSDKRLQEYLKFMAKLYGYKYIFDFNEYRNEELKEMIGEFNVITEGMEHRLIEEVNKNTKKETNKIL